MEKSHPLPATGFLRLDRILGCKKTNIPPIIPVSRTTWWHGVKIGKYPKPVKLGVRTTAWRVEDIRALVDTLGKQGRMP